MKELNPQDFTLARFSRPLPDQPGPPSISGAGQSLASPALTCPYHPPQDEYPTEESNLVPLSYQLSALTNELGGQVVTRQQLVTSVQSDTYLRLGSNQRISPL